MLILVSGSKDVGWGPFGCCIDEHVILQVVFQLQLIRWITIYSIDYLWHVLVLNFHHFLLF